MFERSMFRTFFSLVKLIEPILRFAFCVSTSVDAVSL